MTPTFDDFQPMPENQIAVRLREIEIGLNQISIDFQRLHRSLFDKDEGCIPELKRDYRSLKEWQLKIMGGAGALLVAAKMFHFL